MEVEFELEETSLVGRESDFGQGFNCELARVRGLRHVDRATFNSVVDNAISADAKHGSEFYVIVINAITNETAGVREEHALVGDGLLMLASECERHGESDRRWSKDMGDIVAD